MLISDKTLEKVDSILEQRLNAILVFMGGRDQLPPAAIQSLITAGLISKKIDREAVIEDAYILGRLTDLNKIPKTIAEYLPMRQQFLATATPAELYALKLAKQKICSEMQRHRDVIRTTVSDLILSGNYNYRNMQAGGVKRVLKEGLLRKETMAKLASQLREKTGDLYRDWRRVAITNLTSAMNMGAEDQILANNKDKPLDNIYVYKSVVMDAALCDVCRRVYLESDGITPKIYTMAEIQANGSNMGKKKSEWKATIGPTHPHCRGRLLELPDGWGFKSGTAVLQFYGPKFLWVRDRLKL